MNVFKTSLIVQQFSLQFRLGILFIYWQAHKILVLIASANSEDSDKPSHTHSLARTFAFRKHKDIGRDM